MKAALSSFVLAGSLTSAFAQQLERVYNRDNQESFKLKSVSTQSRVMGPIVKQSTVFTFENPFKKLTEASVWFSLDWASVLGSFAYWYKTEYVPGVLMDKNKAWFIYTAITSRNEDPGIMVQTSPSSYHAQIYPLAVGYDLRVELTSIGFLRPQKEALELPYPGFADEVPFESKVQTYEPAAVQPAKTPEGRDSYKVDYPRQSPLDMHLYAQRFKDGWVYVTGLLRRDDPKQAIRLHGLKNVYWTKPEQGDTDARWFIGRRKGPGAVLVQAVGKDERLKLPIHANVKGAETAQLWAHQKLVQDDWTSRKKVLDFSLKYGIPSAQTALLAVPQEQMKLFRKKEAEWRRQERERARRERQWQSRRSQNWNTTRGGDPELRLYLPEAKKVYASFPDGRVIELKPTGDGYWGGSYDVLASAPEGENTIRISGLNFDGRAFETKTTYEVDRTAPDGTAKIEDGYLVVRSEPKLGRVIVVLANGSEIDLKEDEPGIYKFKLDGIRVVRVFLFDRAHNRRELKIAE